VSFNLRFEETDSRKVEAFPTHDFRHRFFLVDDDDSRSGKEWLTGDLFDWEEQLRPANPDSEWYAFVKDIQSLTNDANHFRANEIPRLQAKEEALAKKVKDLSFHLEVRKKDLATALNRNVRNRSSYYALRDYEARFTLLHGLAQLAQVQAQVIDLLTACIIRRIQARMHWLLPLFCKSWAEPDGDGVLVGKLAIHVWHPFTDAEGNIMEEYLDTDSFRDYPMILQQIMDPKKYKELLLERQQKAKRAKDGKIVIAGEGEVQSMADFKKKFGDGGLAKKP
jgi:hypothetical protein